MLAFGIVAPVFAPLVVRLEGGDTAAAAGMLGLFAAAWALMQFVFSPVQGALSDRFGRRPVILLSNLGLALDYVVMALAPSLAWLFVGRILSGITSSSFATAGAYVADVTPPERRAARFGTLGVAFGIGFILGPAAGGALGTIDLRTPFWAAAVLSFANFAYGAFILPESLPPERRAPFRPHTANPIGALAFVRARPALVPLVAAGFFAGVAHDVLPNLFVIYSSYRYAWDERTIGISLAVVGVCSIVVQGAVVGRVVARFGERRALVAGLVIGIAGQLVYAFAPNGATFLIAIPIWALFGLVNPSLQGLMTRLVAASEQGQLQGALASLRAVASVTAPILFTQIFALAVGDLRGVLVPGASFVAAAILLVASLAAVSRARTIIVPERLVPA
ncbi:MAG: tetracycline resistance MFS efflux pump [Chloroflexi bacterium 13_1_40CM_2_70_6]|nr:MAG: tetracycline resistance MFS efflux pump [Chloroflexi bacterium 13_1_40CM_2_70_6]